jgi:hypothetical protein
MNGLLIWVCYLIFHQNLHQDSIGIDSFFKDLLCFSQFIPKHFPYFISKENFIRNFLNLMKLL